MRDDKVDKPIQTNLFVYPHLLSRSQEKTLQVRCNVSVQTETHINIDSNLTEAVELLQYTPLNDILADALRVSDIPKKYVLKFNDKITEESIDNLDHTSLRDTFEASTLTRSRMKSNLKQLKIMESTEEIAVQTDIMVRPYILHWDELAIVYRDLKVQTSQTFPPDASLSYVAQQLHQYISHHGNTIMPDQSHTVPKDVTSSPMEKSAEMPKSESRPVGKSETAHGASQTDLISEIECETVNHGEVRPLKSKDPVNQDEAGPHPAGANSFGKDCLAKPSSQLTSRDIGNICNTCCTEEQVLAKIEEWYRNVKNMVDNSDDEGEVLGKDMAAVEAEIITSMDHTVEQLETQADRMQRKYAPEKQDIQVQNKEFQDHLSGHNLCKGFKFRDKSCTCDCLLNEKPLHLTCVSDGRIMYPRSICTSNEQYSDLSNMAPEVMEPHMKPRACTLRKCNCIGSEGCGHCERALQSKKKMERSHGFPKSIVAQKFEFLSECDNEYADSYLELLEQDEIGTQTETEILEQTFGGLTVTMAKPEAPCTCMNDVEMPWEMILIPPKPKKREVTDEDVLLETIPEEVRAQLKQLTVQPMSDDALASLLTEFLRDNIGDYDNIEDIQKAVLAEKARVEAEAARALAENDEDEKSPEDKEDSRPYEKCRPRPPLRICQVFDPEDESYNEPYMDRMLRFIEDEDAAPAECTSHVEMPWNKIELPKTVVLRKSKRNPCDFKPRPVVNIDPHRKCGPEYREMMKRRRQMNSPNSRFIPNDFKGTVRVSEPNLPTCACYGGLPVPNMKPPPKGISDTCLCAKPSSTNLWSKDTNQNHNILIPDVPTNSGSPFQNKAITSRTQRVAALLESCKREMEPIKEGINQLRSRIKELNIPDMLAYQDSPPHIAASTSYNYMNGMGGLGASNMVPTMGPGMGMPVCYPSPLHLQMCYPYGPCMFPGASGMPQSSSKHSLGKCGKSGKKGKHRSKSKHRYPSSKYNTSSESTSTVPDRGRKRCRCRRTASKSTTQSRHTKAQQMTKSLPSSETSSMKASSSKLICSCVTTASLPPSVPVTPPTEQQTSCKPSMSSCANEATKSVMKSRIPKLVSLTKTKGNICPSCSLASNKSCGKASNIKGTATGRNVMTKAASSVTFVRSCCTQFTTDEPKSKTSLKSQTQSGCRIVIRVEPSSKGVGVCDGKPVESDKST